MYMYSGTYLILHYIHSLLQLTTLLYSSPCVAFDNWGNTHLSACFCTADVILSLKVSGAGIEEESGRPEARSRPDVHVQSLKLDEVIDSTTRGNLQGEVRRFLIIALQLDGGVDLFGGEQEEQLFGQTFLTPPYTCTTLPIVQYLKHYGNKYHFRLVNFMKYRTFLWKGCACEGRIRGTLGTVEKVRSYLQL